jgi:hypothetical protein
MHTYDYILFIWAILLLSPKWSLPIRYPNHSFVKNGIAFPCGWCLQIFIVSLAYGNDPESYSSGSAATGMASFAEQVKGMRQTDTLEV